MKFRVTSLVLAVLLAGSLILPALAATEETKTSVMYLNGEEAELLEYEMYKSVNYITVESFMAQIDPEAVVEEADGAVAVQAVTLKVVDVEQEPEADGEADDAQPGQEPAQDETQEETQTGTLPEQDGQDEADAASAEQSVPEAADSANREQADGQEQPQPEEETDGAGNAEEDGDTPEANVEEAETLRFTAVVGEKYVQANGRYLYVKDGVRLVHDKVAVPVRVLAKIFNLDVGYDSATENVTLDSQSGVGAYLQDAESYYNADTLYWLSRIIYAESGNQVLEGKISVGNVVMNRVASPLFPDNIYDVLFQRNQFSPAISGSIYRDPNAESVVAAKLVMDGAVALENVLFFNRAGMNSYASRNRPYVGTIGAHAFYA